MEPDGVRLAERGHDDSALRPARSTVSRWVRAQVWPSAGCETGRDAVTVRASLVALLVAHGSSGVVEIGDMLVGYVPRASTDEHAMRAAVARTDGTARVEFQPVVDADWTRSWREGIVAHAAGPFLVAPPWLADSTDAAHRIVIDPGMAFGTGDHPTTRGVLRLLATVARPGDSVADLGAGSAVLSIAAAKLGARTVAAVESDPDAIGNAEDNVRRNAVADRVRVITGDAAALLPLLAPVRLIMANIVSSVLVDLLPAMADALTPDGQAIIAGILVAERETMSDVLAAGGWCVQAADIEGDWWSAIIARR